jgi:hypothetical protein
VGLQLEGCPSSASPWRPALSPVSQGSRYGVTASGLGLRLECLPWTRAYIQAGVPPAPLTRHLTSSEGRCIGLCPLPTQRRADTRTKPIVVPQKLPPGQLLLQLPRWPPLRLPQPLESLPPRLVPAVSYRRCHRASRTSEAFCGRSPGRRCPSVPRWRTGVLANPIVHLLRRQLPRLLVEDVPAGPVDVLAI